MATPVDPLILEALAFRAWPAEEVVDAGRFKLRAMRGVTRRANSAWVDAGANASTTAADDWSHDIARAEAFYAARGLPCFVQVAPVSAPPGLDAWLAARGYTLEAPVSIQTVSAAAVAALSDGSGAAPLVERELAHDWFELSASARFAEVRDVYRGLLLRLGQRAAFAQVNAEGTCAAVGLGVVEDGWCGVFAMNTRAAFRRRGLGRALLIALAQHALARGADRLYLQVERDNGPALMLYGAAGFVECYGYHYRRFAG